MIRASPAPSSLRGLGGSRIESLCDKRFADVEHGGEVTPENLGNLGIRFVGMEQDVGMPDRGGGKSAKAYGASGEQTLVVGKGNGVLALPHEDCILHGDNVFVIKMWDKRH